VHAFYNFNNCPWDEHKQHVEDLMSHMEIPGVSEEKPLRSAGGSPR